MPEASRHYGHIIARNILDIIHGFQIADKIGYFTLNNAKNNTTIMDTIGHELGFYGRSRRGRCIGHVVNLAVKGLLFGNSSDAFEEQFNGSNPLTSRISAMAKKGARGQIAQSSNGYTQYAPIISAFSEGPEKSPAAENTITANHQ
jgi:hypothetical protein